MLPPSSRSMGTCIVRTRQSQTLIDLAPIAELGAKAAKSCYNP
jgi:hypothetical protein